MRPITFQELEERWDELANIFSREAILKGSFDRYVEDTKGMRGTSEVDSAFLKEIEGWREMLAKNIALRNLKLGLEEMNFSVQRIIDRIIFLRICEDRGTEPPDQLREIIDKSRIYRRLMDIFQQADAKYNSGLFHFQIDRKRVTHPDELTPKLKVDDEVLKKIIKKLYYPDSPYQFDVIPADILGQVYEQFLGKVIRLTKGHQAKVEEKPEVKKAGGVYYTPTYIVEYIVKKTVGKLCKGKPPNEMEKLRILDPACGSGSFLIVAYDCLLKEHLEWYMDNSPRKWRKEVFRDQKDEWRLTLREKKRVLLNNIYGVDIDRQAVEVTKLNLLLKALEGESKESVNNIKKWFREPALPDLGNNIKCGNSLVDYDIREILNELPEEERERVLNRINPFPWKDEFKDIMKAGGFDAVIGNPPWVHAGLIMEYKDYLESNYENYTGSSDLYVFFIEKSFKLLNKQGRFGMIISNKWLRADYGQKLRKYLSQNINILQLIDFGELPVFKKVGNFPCIFLGMWRKDKAIKTPYVPIKTLPPRRKIEDQVKSESFFVELTDSKNTNWTLIPPEIDLILSKIDRSGIPLKDYCGGRIRRGVLTGYNPAFIIDKKTKTKLISEDESARNIIKPFVSGNETRRYSIKWQGRYIIFTRRGIDINKYPSVLRHLSQHKKHLEPKKNPKDKIGRKPGRYEWYEIQDSTKYYKEFEKSKIVYGQFQIAPHFAFSQSTLYFGSNHYMIVLDDIPSLLYLCGILNSNLYFFYMKRIAGVLGDPDKKGRLISQKSHILKFPVRTIDFSDPVDKVCYKKIVNLVERMLKLHKDFPNAKTPHTKARIQRMIEATDREIDELVYELYRLTKEEIKIVEES